MGVNYKTTNRLLKKNGGRALFYQVLCCGAVLAVAAPASYVWGVLHASEGVNQPLYQRIFSESARVEGDGVRPDADVADALGIFGPHAIERATYNGMVIWSTTIKAPTRAWENEVAREWGRLGIRTHRDQGTVQGVLGSGRDRLVLIARPGSGPGEMNLFAFEGGGEQDPADAFLTAGLPEPPGAAEIFDHTGSGEGGVALAFRLRRGGDLAWEYGEQLQDAGWRQLEAPGMSPDARIFERDGRRVSLRGMESGGYSYLTLVIF
jgi:hypothetical protein